MIYQPLQINGPLDDVGIVAALNIDTGLTVQRLLTVYCTSSPLSPVAALKTLSPQPYQQFDRKTTA
jgi:hypothetical protein